MTSFNFSFSSLQLKDKERQVIKDKFKVSKDVIQQCAGWPAVTGRWPDLFVSLPTHLRVSTTAWRSFVRSRRAGPSRTKSSGTSSVSRRRKWFLTPTGASYRGEGQLTALCVETHFFHTAKKLFIWNPPLVWNNGRLRKGRKKVGRIPKFAD